MLIVDTGRGAQLCILIKGPETLEQTRRITTIVLDKAGARCGGRVNGRLVKVARGAVGITVSRDGEALAPLASRGHDQANERAGNRRAETAPA